MEGDKGRMRRDEKREERRELMSKRRTVRPVSSILDSLFLGPSFPPFLVLFHFCFLSIFFSFLFFQFFISFLFSLSFIFNFLFFIFLVPPNHSLNYTLQNQWTLLFSIEAFGCDFFQGG